MRTRPSSISRSFCEIKADQGACIVSAHYKNLGSIALTISVKEYILTAESLVAGHTRSIIIARPGGALNSAELAPRRTRMMS